MGCRLSLIVPVRDKKDKKLQELLRSIESQDFPKNEMETLLITEGTSESAKAIGIRKSKGEIIGILASDNELTDNHFLKKHYKEAHIWGASQPSYYFYTKKDNILNRYFALLGGNDILSFYMNKNDRLPFYEKNYDRSLFGKSIGDNGYFVKKNIILNSDLENYSHIENAQEAKVPVPTHMNIWHKTGGNIFKFFAKRYRYGLQHAFNKNRRWHLVDFKQPKDIMRLIWFIIASLTIIQPLILSVRGYMKIKDRAWFIHPVICIITVVTYGLLIIHLGLKKLSQSLSAHLTAKRV